MSGSLKPQDTLAAIGRLLAELDRRLRTVETLPSDQGGPGGWNPELIIAGYARATTNVAPPGLRVPFDCTLTDTFLRLGTAPTGASLIMLVKRGGTTLATLTITAGGTATSSTGLATPLVAGDILTFDVTQIGSTVAGADLAVQLVAS